MPVMGPVMGDGEMPREKINHPRTGVVVDGNDTTETGQRVNADTAVVQVGWHKDSWVQVSIEADVSYFRFAAERPDGDPRDDEDQRSTVYSPPLERDEINHLIRVLRRARDQAFGHDE